MTRPQDRILYRKLDIDEARLLGAIDRSESIDGIYRFAGGTLTLEERRQEVLSWSVMLEGGKRHTQPDQLAQYVARLQALMRSGGTVLGAWDGERLVGLGSLDLTGVGGDPAVAKLDMLYVSAGYRGRGIGRALTDQLARRARSLGATTLYISATPTRATVDTYLGMGAQVLDTPDPELFALQPEDVHLALRLA